MIQSVIFVDPRVEDYRSLTANLGANSQVVLLDPSEDGIRQVTEALREHKGLTDIQFLTHGSAGSVQLAGTDLRLATASERADEIADWRDSLSDGADILFWGCNVAASESGQALIRQIAELTGADVAASDDLTGSSALGGDWALEIATGTLETSVHSETTSAYAGILVGATIDSIVRQEPSSVSTGADSVTFRVTFSEAVTNVDGTDFTFQSISGSAPGATVQLVTPVTGSGGTQFDVLIGGIASANGTLNLDLSPDNNIQTVAGAQSLSSLTPVGADETFTLTNPVQTPTVSAIGSDSGVSSSDAITSDQTLTISGTAIANGIIKVYLDGSSSTDLIGSVTADSSGNWSFDYTSRSLSTGSHTFTATATDSWGSTSAQSSVLSVSVDTTGPVFGGGYVNGSTLTLVYNDANALDGTNLPTTDMFAVTVGGSSRGVSGVAVDSAGKTVTLTLDSAVTSGQAVTVAFTDPSGNTTTTIQDAAGNDSASFSATSVTNITGQSFTTPGFVVGNTGSVGFSKGGDAVGLLDSQPVVIRDDDDTFLESATITISSGKQTGDLLSAGTLPAGISAGNYNSTTGELTLTGHASLTDYQTALSAIDFSSTSSNFGDRTVSIVVDDGGNPSAAATRTVHMLGPGFSIGLSTSAYLLANRAGGSQMDLSRFDLVKNTLTTISTDFTTLPSINGGGFNPLDGHLYAWSQNNGAIRIDSDFTASVLTTSNGGTASNKPANSLSIIAGDVSPDGVMYFLTSGTFYRLDVNPNHSTYLTWLPKLTVAPTTSGTIADFAFHPSDGQIYAVNSTGVLYKFNPATGASATVATLSSSGITGSYWGQYFDSNGFFYLAKSGSTISRVDLTNTSSPSLGVVSIPAGSLPSSGDGARVVNLAFDFGDAPNTYKTNYSADGARHEVSAGQVYLGTGVTSESDATGTTGLTDSKDDGVSLAALNISMASYSTSVAVTNNSSSSATLAGWIDFNRDGIFSGNEAASATVAAGFSGNVNLTWNSLPSISSGDSYARFRLSTDTALNATHSGTTADAQSYGALNDGEVEDYKLTIGGTDTSAPTASFSSISPATRHVSVGTVNVSFSENVTGVDLSDFTLTRDGNSLSLSGLTVSGSGSSYSVDLSSVTQVAGDYVFTLKNSGTGIQDGAGNVSTGTSASFTVDTTAPVIDLAPSDASTRNYSTSIYNNTAVSLDNNSAAATLVETHNLAKITLAVSGVQDGASEKLLFGSTEIAANGGTASAANVGGVSVDIAYSGGVFSLTKTGGGNLTPTEAQSIIRDLQYRNDAATPTGGDRTFSFGATDAAQIDATNAITTVTLNVDLSAPGAPVITGATDDVTPITGNVSSGGSTNDTTPTLSGTAEAGSIVTISDGSTVLGSVTADGSGDWTFTPGTALAEGDYSFTATATDAAGNVSAASSAYTLTVDTTAPTGAGVPVITGASDNIDPVQGAVSSGGSTNDTTPTLSGTAEANSVVTISDGSTVLGSVTADGSGDWTFTPGTALAEGDYSFTATATDAAGNVSAASSAYTLTVDTTAPSAPSITGADDDATPVTGNVSSGGSTNDTTPTLAGTAEANSVVTLSDGSTVLGSVTADGSGDWTFTPGTALGAGSHSFTATATDAAGNVSAASSAYTLTVDTTAPTGAGAPVITGASDNVDPVQGAVSSGGSTNDTTPTLAGTAEANSVVTLSDGSTVLGSVTADGSGDWTFTPGTALGAGSHSFTATATDAAGNVSAASSAYTLTVDTTAPTGAGAPVITGASDNIDPVQGAVSSGGSTNDTTPTLSGTAEANSVVTISDGSTVLGSVTADGSGDWTFTPGTALGAGSHSFTATATDAAGNVSAASSAYTLTVDTTDPNAPVITGAADNVDPVQGAVSSGGSTNDTTPTLAGTAEANSVVTLSDGSTVLGSVTADGSGDWTFTPGTALGAGSHSFTATATDAAGNVSAASSAYTLTVDTTAPTGAGAPVITGASDNVDPVQGAVSSGGSTNDTTPTLSGTAEAGSVVTISDASGVLGSTTANGSGNWTFTPGTALAEGDYSFTATATDAAGNVSAASSAYTLTVDTTAPTGAGAPVITGASDNIDPVQGAVSSGGSTNDTTPTLSGTAEANSVVTISDGSTVLGSVTADGSGDWTFTPGTALGAGSHSFTATATDAAGNVSAASSAYTLTVDTTDPNAPVITGAADNVDPVQGAVSSGGSTNDTTPTLAGTAEANSVVTLSDGSTVLGSVTADGSGDWTFTPGTALGAGSHSFTATATDAAGNVSAASSAYTLTVDTTAPTGAGAPVITGASDNVDPVQGAVSSGGSTNDTTPTLSGTAEAGSVVTISDASGVLGSTTANGSGNWTFTPGTALAEGDYSFTATATDAAGNVSAASSAYTLTVDTTAPTGAGAPVITGASDNVDPVQGAVSSGGSTNDTTPTLSGTAEANSVVTLSDGSTVLGSVTADGSGDWTFTPGTALGAGSHSFTATATDAAGNVSAASSAYTLTVDTTAPTGAGAPVITGASDNVDPVQGAVSSGGSTNDTTPTLSGTAEANSVVTISDGSTVLGSVTADGSGDWTFTPGTALGAGSHSFTATATDAAGNVSAASSAYTLTVDTTAPTGAGAPVITGASDNVDPVQGAVSSGGSTNDTTPTLSGTAEANSVVTISDGSTVLGSVTADGSGDWTFTPGTALAEGDYSFTATATDAAGNVSAASSAYTLTVDTTAPSAPSITGADDDATPVTGNVSSGGSTNDTTPTLSGTAEANSVVTLSDGSTVLGSVTADGSGDWTFTPGTALGAGSHSFTATATDAAGNVSAASSAYTLTVDTTAPTGAGAPVITGASDNVDPVQGAVSSGGSTNDTTPTLSGTAEAGSVVTISDASGVLGSTTANGSGNWTFTPGTALAEGDYSFTATATDAAGNVSAASSAYTLTVDTTAPTGAGAPVITGASDNVDPVQGAVSSGGSTNDTTPTLSGTAEANSVVTISDGSTVLGSVTADGSGDWTFTPGTALAEGDYSFTATATDAAGNVSADSSAYTLTVDTTDPTQVATIAAMTKDTGAADFETADGSAGRSVSGTLSATLAAGETLQVSFNGGTTWTSATVSGTDWSVTDSGSHDGNWSIQARVIDSAGNTGPLATRTVILSGAPTQTVSITGITDDVAPITGSVANDGTTNDTSPTLNGTLSASLGAHEVLAVYREGTRIGTATVTGTSWTYSDSGLSDGFNYSYDAQVENTANGENGPTSAGYAITVDTSVPSSAGLVISAISSDTGSSATDFLTRDTTLTVSGSNDTLASGETIQISSDGGSTWSAVTQNTATSWSFVDGTTHNSSFTYQVRVIDAAGNPSDPVSQAVTIDTTAPAIPSITSANDDVSPVTGVIGEGAVTNDARPTLTGSADANTIVHVYDGASLLGSVTANGSGAWTFTPDSNLAAGGHRFTVTATDTAGNTSEASAPRTLSVDVTAPGAPSISAVADNVAPVTGPVSNSGTTNDPTPTLSGSALPNSVVHLYDGLSLLGSVTANGSGNWSFTPSSNLADGPHSFTATATDAAGNVSPASSARTLTVDTDAPDQLATIAAMTKDTGAADFETTDGSAGRTVSGTLSAALAAGETLQVSFNNGSTWTAATVSGTDWTVTDNTAHNGSWTLVARVADAAGNLGNSSSQVVTLAGSPAQTATIGGIADDVSPVTGNVANGAATNDTSPVLSGTLSAALGGNDVLAIYRDGAKIGNASVNGTAWTFADSGLSDGATYSYTVQVENTASGNSGVASSPYQIAVDTTAPSTALIIGAISDDTGTSASDFLTADTRLTVSGTNEALNSGEIIQVSNDGGGTWHDVTQDTSTTWSYADPAEHAASFDYQVRIIDAAGNVGTTASQAVTLDTSAPDAPVITGVNDSVEPVTGNVLDGGITNDAGPTLTGTSAPNSIVKIYDGATLLGSVNDDGAGNWSFTPSSRLDDGSHAFTATATDAAGNESAASTPWTVAIDTEAPSQTIDIVAMTKDTGSADFETTDGSAGRTVSGTLSGILGTGERLELSFDGGATWSSASVTGTDWSADDGGAHSGDWTIRARLADSAGNTGSVTTQNVILAGVPTQTAIIATITDDVAPMTGDLATGATTNDTAPSLSGTLSAALQTNEVLAVYRDGVKIGEATASGTQWTYADSGLADGTSYGYTVQVENTASGNHGTASASYSITVDTRAPNAPVITDADDDAAPITGSISDGGSTNDTTPTLSGTAEANSVVTISDGSTALGSVTADGSGNWTFTPASDLSEASHSFTATATDAAGNVSAASSAYTLTVDTTAPAGNGAPVIVSASDNVDPVQGTLSSGGSTNDPTPTLAGTAEANSIVMLSDGATVLGSTTADGSGNWTFTPDTALAEGSHSFTVTATDAAGNVSAASSAYTLTVDTSAPAGAGAPVIVSASDNVDPVLGTVGSGGTTNDVTPTLSGTAEANSVVTVSDGATVLGSTTADGSGNWTFTPGTALGEATHSFTATATDAAGNVSAASSAYTLTVDTSAPNAPTISGVGDDAAPVIGNVANGGTSNDLTPTLSGIAVAGSVVRIYDGETLLGSATADGFGAWTLTPSALTDGPHAFTATATDAAGNLSEASAPWTLTIDTVAPAQTATIVSMTKDTGTADFRTADGSAGRTVSGTLTGPLADGETLNVSFDGGSTWTSATISGTDWLANDGANHNGSWTIQAQVIDAAGNLGTVANQNVLLEGAPTQTVTIAAIVDDQAPVIGTIANGGRGNDTAPALNGTLSAPLEAGQVLGVYRDGAKLGNALVTGTDWSFADSGLIDGSTYTYSAQVETSSTGTHGLPSVSYSISVDTSIPAAASLDLPAEDDTGTSNADNITGRTTVALQGIAEPGTSVEIFRPDGGSLGTATADSEGRWKLPGVDLTAIDGDDRDGIIGEDGPYTFSAVATDPAGNQAPAGQMTLVLDTRGTVVDLPAAFDTGVSDSDDLTNAATVTLQGQAPLGSEVRILRPDGSVLATLPVDANGQWSLPSVDLRTMDGDDLDGIVGEDGPYTFRAEIPQANGGAVPAGNLKITLDTTPPSTPLTLDLPAAQDTDTGAKVPDPHADNVTALPNPTLDVVLPTGAGADIRAGYIAKVSYQNAAGTQVELGTATLTEADVAAGKTSVPISELLDGDYRLNVRLFDPAGNFQDEASLPLTIVTDLDGVMPSTESAVRGGDFNQDGVQDYLQSNVATFPVTSPAAFEQGSQAPAASFGALIAGNIPSTTDGRGNVVVDAAAQLAEIKVQSPTSYWAEIGIDLSSQLADITVDPVMNGLLDFTIKAEQGGAPLTDLDTSRTGLQTRVVLELPEGVRADTFFKVGRTTDNATPHVYAFMADGNPATLDDGAELFDLDGNGTVDRVIITYTDGANGDDDLTVNGEIHDPGFLGIGDPCLCDDDGIAVPGLTLKGTKRADNLTGSINDDFIKGMRKGDILSGGDGDDRLDGGKGRDTLDGGNGRDTLIGGAGRDVLKGGECEDNLNGGRGKDILDGGNGKDVLLGGGASDQINGGDCDDQLNGGRGRDFLYGDAGDDMVLGAGGRDRIYGGIGNDTLDGGRSKDTVYGESGNDLLKGGGARDILYGGLGNDTLDGGRGRDQIFGDEGNDTLLGGISGDRLIGGAGNDVMKGGGQKDTYLYLAAALGQDDLTAGMLDSITETAGRNILDFGSTIEQVLKFNGQTLSALSGKVNIQGSIGADTGIVFDRAGQTLRIDLDGNGVFDAALDAQIQLIGVKDVVYQAATDQFMLMS